MLTVDPTATSARTAMWPPRGAVGGGPTGGREDIEPMIDVADGIQSENESRTVTVDLS